MPEIRSVIKNRGSKKFAFISQDCSWVAVEALSSERKWKVKSKAEKTGTWRASPGVGAVLPQVTDQPVTKYRLNTWAVQDAVQWFSKVCGVFQNMDLQDSTSAPLGGIF